MSTAPELATRSRIGPLIYASADVLPEKSDIVGCPLMALSGHAEDGPDTVSAYMSAYGTKQLKERHRAPFVADHLKSLW